MEKKEEKERKGSEWERLLSLRTELIFVAARVRTEHRLQPDEEGTLAKHTDAVMTDATSKCLLGSPDS